MKKYLTLFLIILPIFCSCNKFKEFKDYFIAFDVAASDATRIDCEGRLECNYVVHLASTTPRKPIIVQYSIIPGDGLVEGIDYELATQKKTVEFFPGVFNKSIKIKWLPNPIDAAKDNTLTIRLESSNSDINLGFPGPEESNRTIIITKYINN